MSDQDSAQKAAKEHSHRFIDWMDREHGHVPYGFHNSLIQFWMSGVSWAREHGVTPDLVARMKACLEASKLATVGDDKPVALGCLGAHAATNGRKGEG